MKFIVWLIAYALSCQWSVAAQAVRQDAKDYYMGELVGECLVIKCQVFRGYPLTESPKPGDAVPIRVVEWLFGTPPTTGIVAVPFEEQSRNGAVNDPARAWIEVAISTNTAVTVVLGLEKGLAGAANEPVLVASDDRRAEIIRFLTEESSRLQNSPDSVPDSVASLSRSPNAALAGFLVPYLTFSKSIKQRTVPARMLLQMLGNPGVPSEGWDDIAFWALMATGALGPEGHEMAVRRFIELVQQQDSIAATTGLNQLARFAQNGYFLDHLIPPAALGKLTDAYRGLVAARKMNRSQPLEAALGIK